MSAGGSSAPATYAACPCSIDNLKDDSQPTIATSLTSIIIYILDRCYNIVGVSLHELRHDIMLTLN